MTHPLVSRLAPLMDGDIEELHRIVAESVLAAACDHERTMLRYFGAELGAVQRRIERRPEPPTEEDVEIALTAVLALSSRQANPGSVPRLDPAFVADSLRHPTPPPSEVQLGTDFEDDGLW